MFLLSCLIKKNNIPALTVFLFPGACHREPQLSRTRLAVAHLQQYPFLCGRFWETSHELLEPEGQRLSHLHPTWPSSTLQTRGSVNCLPSCCSALLGLPWVGRCAMRRQEAMRRTEGRRSTARPTEDGSPCRREQPSLPCPIIQTGEWPAGFIRILEAWLGALLGTSWWQYPSLYR